MEVYSVLISVLCYIDCIHTRVTNVSRVQETGANIKVYSQCCPQSTERVVQICGKTEVIVNCIASIFELLQSVSVICDMRTTMIFLETTLEI